MELWGPFEWPYRWNWGYNPYRWSPISGVIPFASTQICLVTLGAHLVALFVGRNPEIELVKMEGVFSWGYVDSLSSPASDLPRLRLLSETGDSSSSSCSSAGISSSDDAKSLRSLATLSENSKSHQKNLADRI